MNNRRNNIKRLAGYLKQKPDDTFTRFALALELIKENEVSKAKVLFEAIRKDDPDYTGVYYHLGKLYEQIGQFEQALETYQMGIDKCSGSEYQRTKLELQEALEQLKNELRYHDELP